MQLSTGGSRDIGTVVSGVSSLIAKSVSSGTKDVGLFAEQALSKSNEKHKIRSVNNFLMRNPLQLSYYSGCCSNLDNFGQMPIYNLKLLRKLYKNNHN